MLRTAQTDNVQPCAADVMRTSTLTDVINISVRLMFPKQHKSCAAAETSVGGKRISLESHFCDDDIHNS